jgi:hypothetical protein
MDELQARPVLRALSIGEIFDRAVTMYVRNFVVFTLTVLTLLVPLGVLEYFLTASSTSSLAQLMQQIAHPTSPMSSYSSTQIGAFSLLILVAAIFSPFTNNAVAVGVAAIYAGRTPTYRDGYARVLRRWGPLVGAMLLCVLIFIGAYLAIVLGVTILVLTGTALLAAAPALGIPLALVGIVLLLAVVLFFLLLVLCCAFTLYATTIEEVSPADAFGESFRRIFNRRELGKATLISLAYLAIEFGAAFLGGAVGLLVLSAVHSTIAQLAVNTVINAAVTAFITILVAVYYYDVRTRSEGLDLEVELERLTAPT